MARNPRAWPQSTWWLPAARTVAVLGPLLTSVVLSAVRDSVPTATAVLVLVVWVVGAAATGDRVSPVLAAVSAGVWFDFFLTKPYHRFTISDADDVQVAILLVLIGLAVSELALWGYRQQKQAALRSGYLDGVLGAARAVADGGLSRAALLDLVAPQIAGVLGADGCRYVEGPVHDARIAVLDHDGVLTRSGRAVDVDRTGLPTDEYVAVLVARGPSIAGHFLLTTTSHLTYPTREQRRVAVLLADQVASGS